MIENQKKNVIIIGGGASGMAAAIAARRAGANVTILEKEDKLGRKLLATGNGRCNLTNVGSLAGSYRGAEPSFAQKVLEGFSVTETLSFFHGLGLHTTVENDRVYPYSGQAETVLHVLLRELARLGVRCKCGEEAAAAGRTPEDGGVRPAGFLVRTKTWEYACDALILACGTSAGLTKKQLPANGLSLAKNLGHGAAAYTPGLVPLRVAEAQRLAFAGVRIGGAVTICIDGRKTASDTGQLQLTENGISGIPVFNVSGPAGRALRRGSRVTAILDFLPEIPKKETAAFLSGLAGARTPAETLRGLLPERLVRAIFRSFEGREPSLLELSARLREFPLTVTGTVGEERAQVLSGGVLTREVFPETLESRLVPGLYLTGELLDIDGICGGFNLQFAWSTGILAGRAAGGKE